MTTPESEVFGLAVGARMRTMRLEAGLSQNEVAQRMGSHRPIISRLERGDHTPSLEVIASYARAVRCAPMDLVSVVDGVQHVVGGQAA